MHPFIICQVFDFQTNPTLIKGFGFDTIKANALSSVGRWISLILMITYGFARSVTPLNLLYLLIMLTVPYSDRIKNKGPIVILACFPYLILWIACKFTSAIMPVTC